KSPWQTAVDVIADQSEVHVISKKEFENNKFPKMDMFIIKDENNMYAGAVDDGDELEIKALDNDTPLHDATEIIHNTYQQLFTIIKSMKIVWVLSYSNIVDFLKSKTRVENGVVQS